MKTWILLALALVASDVLAAPQIGPQGRKSSYYYFELPPKEALVLTLQSDKICANDTDKITVSEFDSTARYRSTENEGVTVPVRVKSLFAEASSICSSLPIGKIEKKVVIGPYKSQMTHIRITTSDGMQVLHGTL